MTIQHVSAPVVDAKKAVLLPTDNSVQGVANQGFPISTEVGQSSIEGAGNGRYAKQDVAAGEVVVQKALMPMAGLASVLNVDNDTTITFACVADLEKYIKLMETEGGFPRDVILALFEHFMYAFDRKVCCLNVSTWTINHAENEAGGVNCVVDFQGAQLPDGRPAYVCRSTGIKTGAELFMDYNKFAQPDFYLAYSKRHGFNDVQTSTLKAVHGEAGAENLLKGIYGANHARFQLSVPSLPTDNSVRGVANQGFPISTEVGQSSIEGAGNGRYAKQDVAAGEVVVQKALVPMAELASVLNVDNDTTITFACVADLEKYIKLMETEGGFPRDVILSLFEHFMYAFDRKVCCLNVSTWTINHAETEAGGLNCVVDFQGAQLPDGRPAYVCRSTGIKTGAELFMDYNKFAQPDFYLAYSKRHGFNDVQTTTLKAVHGDAGAENLLKGIYGANHARFQLSVLALPTDNSVRGVANQGFPISTEVGQSSIEGAGNGRYAKQDVAAGEVVVQKALVPMAELASVLNVDKDTTITFACVADLEKYIKLMETEGGFPRDVILTLFEHFMYALDRNVCCLNVSTWTINHAENAAGGLNCVVDFQGAQLPDGRPAYVCRSTGIKTGAELFMDYGKFAQPDFYLAYSKRHDFDDVQTTTLKAVHGQAGAENLLKGIYGAGHARFQS